MTHARGSLAPLSFWPTNSLRGPGKLTALMGGDVLSVGNIWFRSEIWDRSGKYQVSFAASVLFRLPAFC
jgi:hypothetical protein